MNRRLEAFFTVLLVTQILLPFTAPFPVCDFTDVFGSGRQHGVPIAPRSSSTPQTDAAYTDAPPLATTTGRLKLVVVFPLAVSDFATSQPPVVIVRQSVLIGFADEQPQLQQTVLRL